MTPTPETREAAHSRLVDDLTDLHDSGQLVPCLEYPHAGWTDDGAEAQRFAARLCSSCPALAACTAYVTAWPERAGVWAGTTETDRRKDAA